MAETSVSQLDLPRWFVQSYLFSPDLVHVDKKKWLIRMVIAIGWLTMATISYLSTKASPTRIIVSFGFEVLGEYVHKVGNISTMMLMVQYLLCQLIQFITFGSINTHTLLQPLISTQTINLAKKEQAFVSTCDIVVRVFCIGFSTFSGYLLYGRVWYILIFKFALGTFAAFMISTGIRLMICNCLFLNRTCQTVIRKVTTFQEKLAINHQSKTKQVAIKTVCTQFQALCIELNNQNQYWKKVIFVNTSTVIPIIVTGAFMVLEVESRLMKVIGLISIGQMLVAASLFYLSPAKVESKLRKCYPLMCQLLRYRSINWTLKLKLLRLVKQFDNQISFSNWDTNKLDYMDYNEVSVTLYFRF